MCRALEVSRSGYYDGGTRPPRLHEQPDQAVSVRITAHCEANRHVYGTRRLQDCVAEEGAQGSRRRIAGHNAAQIESHDRLAPRPGGGAPCVGSTLRRR